MLNFVKDAFRGLMEVALWLNLIGCTIVVAVLWSVFRLPGGGFIGFIIGVVVGLLGNIVLGGTIATFLEVAEDSGQMKQKLDKIDISLGALGLMLAKLKESINNANSDRPANQSSLENSAGETWQCKNCGTTNEPTATACKGCGYYKEPRVL